MTIIPHNRCIPILAPLLRNRGAARIVAAAASYQIMAVAVGWPAWPCPVWHLLGVPCPTCGVSRASAALLPGNLGRAMQLHAFAPVLLLALVLVACASILPARIAAALSRRVEAIERSTGVSLLIVIALLMYWIARLAFAPALFIALIRG